MVARPHVQDGVTFGRDLVLQSECPFVGFVVKFPRWLQCTPRPQGADVDISRKNFFIGSLADTAALSARAAAPKYGKTVVAFGRAGAASSADNKLGEDKLEKTR